MGEPSAATAKPGSVVSVVPATAPSSPWPACPGAVDSSEAMLIEDSPWAPISSPSSASPTSTAVPKMAATITAAPTSFVGGPP